MSKAEKTRQYIIEQVSPLFNKHGYSGTSISQIIKTIGLTKGAVYGNFDSKEAIALHALRYNYEQISEKINTAAMAYENSCDRLAVSAAFFEQNYDYIDSTGGCPLFNAASENDDGNPSLKELVHELILDWEATIVHSIKRGIRRKEIKKNTNIKQFVTLFISLIEGGIMLTKTTGDKTYLSAAVRQVIEAVNTKLRISCPR